MHIHAQRKVDHDREVDLIVKCIGSQNQYHDFYHDVDHNLDYNFDHNFDYDFDTNLDHKYGLIVDLIENYRGFHGPRMDQSRITMVFHGPIVDLIKNYYGFHDPRVDLSRITMVLMVQQWIN